MGKKTFMQGNPALQFITESTNQTKEEPKKPQEPIKEVAEAAPANQSEAPEGFKMNPLYREKKTRRVQLLMQPSLHAKVKEAAAEAGLSVNDYIHRALEDYLRGE